MGDDYNQRLEGGRKDVYSRAEGSFPEDPPDPTDEGRQGPMLDESDDIRRVKAAYQIEDFPYRVWPEERAQPDPHWIRAYTGLEDIMATQSSGPRGAGAPIPWEMPEDLRNQPLPILSRMGEVDTLIYEMRRKGNHPVSEVSTDESLPELRDEASELGEPVLPPIGKARASQHRIKVATQPRAKSSEVTREPEDPTSAKNKLRSLALKGVKNA